MKAKDRLVIFDCDGVLVDSERLSCRIMARMAGELGLRIGDDEAYERFRGRKVGACFEEIAVAAERRLPDGIIPEFRERCEKAFRLELSAVPHIDAVLDGLELPYCVASSGPRDKIRFTLGLTGLLPRFEGRIYSAYEVGTWKPEPGLFLHAAADMGVRPEACAVVEDSTVGIRAGVAAGMTVFAYAPDGEHASLVEMGATPFRSMRDLPPLLARWCERPLDSAA